MKKVTKKDFINWLVLGTQIETNNFSEEFKSSVIAYYEFMPDKYIESLAKDNGFEIEQEISFAEQLKDITKNTEEEFEKQFDEKLEKQNNQYKINTDTEKSEKNIKQDIKEIFKNAFPDITVITSDELKEMGVETPSSLTELLKGLKPEEIDEKECECLICKANKEEAKTEELSESEAFVSSLLSFFEVDSVDDATKYKQSEDILKISNLLLEKIEPDILNKIVQDLPIEISTYIITNECSIEQSIVNSLITNDIIKLRTTREQRESIYKLFRKLIFSIQYEQLKKIKKNICKHLEKH